MLSSSNNSNHLALLEVTHPAIRLVLRLDISQQYIPPSAFPSPFRPLKGHNQESEQKRHTKQEIPQIDKTHFHTGLQSGRASNYLSLRDRQSAQGTAACRHSAKELACPSGGRLIPGPLCACSPEDMLLIEHLRVIARLIRFGPYHVCAPGYLRHSAFS